MTHLHSPVVKAVSPAQHGWRQRLAQNEPRLIRAFNRWVTLLQAQIQEAQIVAALVSHAGEAFEHVLQAVTFQPDTMTVAAREAEQTWADIEQQTGKVIRLSFDLHDPNFDRVVQAHQAALVREVTDETRRALANMIERGYRSGWDTRRVAREIHAAVGLTRRQANAVLTYSETLTRRGVHPDRVADRSITYARKLRGRRALTIARTETARAAVVGRLASYEQAAGKGLFDRATAELEWSSVQQDPAEICAQLDGERVPFGQTFDGMLPPVHPCCRCAVFLVLD